LLKKYTKLNLTLYRALVGDTRSSAIHIAQGRLMKNMLQWERAVCSALFCQLHRSPLW